MVGALYRRRMAKITRQEVLHLSGRLDEIKRQIDELLKYKADLQQHIMYVCPHDKMESYQEHDMATWYTRHCPDCGASEIIEIGEHRNNDHP